MADILEAIQAAQSQQAVMMANLVTGKSHAQRSTSARC